MKNHIAILSITVLNFFSQAFSAQKQSPSYAISVSSKPVTGTASIGGSSSGGFSTKTTITPKPGKQGSFSSEASQLGGKPSKTSSQSPGFFDRIKSNFKDWQTNRELKNVEKKITQKEQKVNALSRRMESSKKEEQQQSLSELEKLKTQQQSLQETQQRRSLKKEEQKTGELAPDKKILFEQLKQKKWGAEEEKLQQKKSRELKFSDKQRLNELKQKKQASTETVQELKEKNRLPDKVPSKASKFLGIEESEVQKKATSPLEKNPEVNLIKPETETSVAPQKAETKLTPQPLLSNKEASPIKSQESVSLEDAKKFPITQPSTSTVPNPPPLPPLKEQTPPKKEIKAELNIPTPPPPPPVSPTKVGSESNTPPPPPPPPLVKSQEKTGEKQPLKSDLLGDIQKGATLKKVEPPVEKKPQTDDTQSLIKKIMAARRKAIAGDEDDKTPKTTQSTPSTLQRQIQEQEKPKLEESIGSIPPPPPPPPSDIKIKQEPQIPLTNNVPKESLPMQNTGSRNDLLDQIKQGTNLKKTSPNQVSTPTKEDESVIGGFKLIKPTVQKEKINKNNSAVTSDEWGD